MSTTNSTFTTFTSLLPSDTSTSSAIPASTPITSAASTSTLTPSATSTLTPSATSTLTPSTAPTSTATPSADPTSTPTSSASLTSVPSSIVPSSFPMTSILTPSSSPIESTSSVFSTTSSGTSKMTSTPPPSSPPSSSPTSSVAPTSSSPPFTIPTSSLSTTSTTTRTLTTSTSTSSQTPTTTSTHPTSSAPSTTATTSTSQEVHTSPTPTPTSSPHFTTTPSTTFSTTFFVVTTNSQGQTTTTAPTLVTATLTSTGSDGSKVTVTQIGINPTLNPNSGGSSSKGSAFFQNTGAVAGVFVLVGLAAASIFLWVFFAVRRRRKTRRLEHDTAVSATLAAAGFNRSPLDDGDDYDGTPGVNLSNLGSSDPEMGQRRSSSGLAMATLNNSPRHHDSVGYEGANNSEVFNPYTHYPVPANVHDGYVPARTSTPPVSAETPHHEPAGSNDARFGHSASYSGGSYEPLLASFNQGTSTPPHGSPVPPTPPQRNPKRLTDRQVSSTTPPPPADRRISASSVYSSDGSAGDSRLTPGLKPRVRPGEKESALTDDLRDDADYSRPVLAVRNLPSAQES